MADTPQPQPQPLELKVDIDDEVANGQYVNLALINHTDAEFTLDFIYVQPQQPRARVRSRVITSPRHMKRLLLAMQDNLARYEARYGAIELAEEAPSPWRA